MNLPPLLQQLIDKAEKATPGPWWLETREGVHRIMAHIEGLDPAIVAFECVYGRGVGHQDLIDECQHTAAFIAAANPEVVKALCEAVQVLQYYAQPWDHDSDVVTDSGYMAREALAHLNDVLKEQGPTDTT